MDDICTADSCDENTILLYLKRRFEKKSIYTYASKLLIAVNPFEFIQNLYTDELVKKYAEKMFGELPPHIYAIANDALEKMRQNNDSQAILISGITGAGKTKTAAQILRFLCSSASNTVATSITEGIMDSSIILEVFGNATTPRNRDSSRFFKFIELAYIANVFALETSRVCGKENFHIFKLLFDGPNANGLSLSHDTKYEFLPDEVGSNHDLNAVDTVLNKLGLKCITYQVICAILNLGNCQFDESDDNVAKIASETEHFLDKASKLLNVSAPELKNAVLLRSICVSGSNIRIPLTAGMARKARNSLVKALYDRLFRDVVSAINSSTPVRDSTSSIATLDIAGFEFFDNHNNTFDQLIINFMNERFQRFFVEQTLAEAKDWIECGAIPFSDNTKIIEIFDHNSMGIFNLLKDECKKPEPSLNNFMDQFSVTSDFLFSPFF